MKNLTAVIYPAMQQRSVITALFLSLLVCASGSSLAEAAEMERLFYTPAQRTQLETARARHAQPSSSRSDATSDEPPPPLRYDGIVTRSDGKTLRWVDGKPQVGTSSVSGLKPGQIRANGKVYEPYQVLRPSPVEPTIKDAAP